jgi:hypothetical protein
MSRKLKITFMKLLPAAAVIAALVEGLGAARKW